MKFEDINECPWCGCPKLYTIPSKPATRLMIRCRRCNRTLGELTDIDWRNLTMPFGKYKGHRLKDIPENYIRWGNKEFKGNIIGKCFFDAVCYYDKKTKEVDDKIKDKLLTYEESQKIKSQKNNKYEEYINKEAERKYNKYLWKCPMCGCDGDVECTCRAEDLRDN